MQGRVIIIPGIEQVLLTRRTNETRVYNPRVSGHPIRDHGIGKIKGLVIMDMRDVRAHAAGGSVQNTTHDISMARFNAQRIGVISRASADRAVREITCRHTHRVRIDLPGWRAVGNLRLDLHNPNSRSVEIGGGRAQESDADGVETRSLDTRPRQW